MCWSSYWFVVGFRWNCPQSVTFGQLSAWKTYCVVENKNFHLSLIRYLKLTIPKTFVECDFLETLVRLCPHTKFRTQFNSKICCIQSHQSAKEGSFQSFCPEKIKWFSKVSELFIWVSEKLFFTTSSWTAKIWKLIDSSLTRGYLK